MAREEAGRLPQVLARVGTSHGITDLACKLRFYDDWAPEYDQVKARGSSILGTQIVQSENSTHASQGRWELKKGNVLLSYLLPTDV